MALEPEQIPSRTCGCVDCLLDYPPAQYGPRPPQSPCEGPWRVRYRSVNGTQRAKSLPTLRDAHQFLATVRPAGRRRAA
ncbi:hypothetical protein TPA0905_07930 [Streptomyces olivaceus]|nr:hypothetical protein TPA0905_07930 [Streptomyces olivaceus]